MEEKVAKAMSDELGVEIKAEQIVKLPSDGTEGHQGMGTWDVYTARCGEFVLVAYAYQDEDAIDVEVI